MPKTVGYISQNLDNSVPVPSVPVTQKLVGTNAPTGVSASTDTNGRYTLTNDDYPGLVYTDAIPAGTSQVIRRRGDTVGQIGEIWSGDLVGFLDMFTEGVHPTVTNALQVGPGSGLQVTMQPGSAIVRGHPFIVTGTKNFTVATNALSVTRRDRVVVQLTRTGDLAGKLERLLIQGSTDGSLAPLVQSGTTWQLPIATVNVVQNASAFSGSDITDDRARFTIPSTPGAGTVGTTQLIDGAVSLAKLASNSVDASKIVDGSVGTLELVDGSVTLAKHAANSVDASKIVDLSVGTAELADLGVTGAKIAAGTIPEGKLDAAALAKLNAVSGGAPIYVSFVRDGATTNATASTTGVVCIGTSITIPSDGKTYDIIATGNIAFISTTGALTQTELRVNGVNGGWVGGANTDWQNYTHQVLKLAVPTGNNSVQIYIRTASGTTQWAGGRLDIVATPR